MTRHRNFVSAMEAQISRVEAALRESYNMEGKEPLPWVRLDENECDDLAQFLSGSSQTMKDEHPMVRCTTEALLEDHKTTKDFDLNAEVGKRNLLNQDAITSNMAAHFTREQEIIEISQSRHDKNYEADRLLSSENAVNNSALEIVIDNGYGQMATSMSTEITPKEKGFKPPFWRLRGEDHRQAKGGMLRDTQLMRLNWINQVKFYSCFKDCSFPILYSLCRIGLAVYIYVCACVCVLPCVYAFAVFVFSFSFL